MDRAGAGFGRTVKEIVARLGTRVVLVNVPYFLKDPQTSEMIFQGVIDIFNKKLLVWKSDDGKNVEVTDINDEEKYPELYEECMNCREAAIEQLGEFDEEVINSFFETEDYMKVPADVIKNALRKATLEGYAVPVLCGSSFKNIGVQPLIEAVNDYLPSPIDVNPPEITASSLARSSKSKKNSKKKAAVEVETSLPVSVDPKFGCVINKKKHVTSALAFKVITHPIRGIMVFVRVYSGKLQPGATVINTTTGEKIRIGKLLLMHGDVPEEVKFLNAGNIGVITATDNISTGDTLITNALTKTPNQLSSQESHAKLLPIEIPPPVFSVSIEPSTPSDKRKLDNALAQLLKEDPSLKLGYDEEADQTILSGMGELHLEITKERLLTDMKVNADIGEIRVTYKETITSPTAEFSKSVDSAGAKESFSVSLSLDSYEGALDDTSFVNEENSFVLEQDQNIVIFEKGSTPSSVQKALDAPEYHFGVAYDTLLSAIIAGINGSLQIGGKIARLPLHSCVVRVKKWTVPTEATSASDLVQVSRLAI
ncbi:unnamed protein product [Ambrosiozyma monospora]|uniref:Unnamed protein product n=1 Tax=Ambrosiozyma monospora TaxID=43982 RepID=A0ACB5T6X9_AMBMO|nr:unnamed protein product [Ambrosiozyma monospora]